MALGGTGVSKASKKVQSACNRSACNGAACTTLQLHPKMASMTLRRCPWEETGPLARRAEEGEAGRGGWGGGLTDSREEGGVNAGSRGKSGEI